MTARPGGYDMRAPLPPEQNGPRPCFHCMTEPVLDGHRNVCASCHDEARCPVCHPGFAYVGEAEHVRLLPQRNRR